MSHQNLGLVLFFLCSPLCVGKLPGTIYRSDFLGLGCDMLLNKMKSLNYPSSLASCSWHHGHYLHALVFAPSFWLHSRICSILYEEQDLYNARQYTSSTVGRHLCRSCILLFCRHHYRCWSRFSQTKLIFDCFPPGILSIQSCYLERWYCLIMLFALVKSATDYSSRRHWVKQLTEWSEGEKERRREGSFP